MSLTRSDSGDCQNSGTGRSRGQNIHAVPAQDGNNHESNGPIERILRKVVQRISPTAEEEDAEIVASAIDFLPDGNAEIHYSFDRAKVPGDRPLFACSVPLNGIRVIFYNTKDVFTQSPREIDQDGADGNARIVPDCEACMPSPEASNDQDDTTSCTSLDSATTSHVSPKTKLSTATDYGASVSSQRSGRSVSRTGRGDCASERNGNQSNISRDSSRSLRSLDSLHAIYEFQRSKEEWKRYRGGTSLDSMKVSQIWDRDSGGASLPIGTNFIVDLDATFGKTDFVTWLNQIRGEEHTITFGGVATSFFTAPNLLRSSWQDSENALEVEIRIFSLLSPDNEENVLQASSPLGDELWNVLCSKKSAMALFNGDVEMGARLLALDLLAAVLVCWLGFLESVHRESARRPHSFDDKESLEQYQPLLVDREYVADFRRSTRDLLQAFDATIDSIQIAENFDKEQKTKFRYLLLNCRTQREKLQSTMKDIEEYMDSQVAQAERMTHERQDASLKRLTLVASIFLPLTTACSLLSMTNRVKDIGAIWWDWLGIVVIIGFLVFVGYRVTSGWHNFWHKPRVRWQVHGWRQRWAQAMNEVLAANSDRKMLFRRVLTGQAMASLVPTSTRFILRAFKYLFVVAAVTSFLVGMFVSVPTGAEALGYSAAGTIPAAVIAILTWKLVKLIVMKSFTTLLKLILRRNPSLVSRIPNSAIDEEISQDQSQSPQGNYECEATSDEGQPHGQTRTRPVRKRSSMMWRTLRFMLRLAIPCIIVPVMWMLKAMKWLFTLFFGDQILLVVRQMITYLIRSYIPDTVVWGIRGCITALKEKREHSARASDLETNGDRERSRSRSRSRSRDFDRERRVVQDSKIPRTLQNEKELDRRKSLNRRNEDETGDGLTRAKTWTRTEVKRTPTQNFFIRGNKIQRRAATLPQSMAK